MDGPNPITAGWSMLRSRLVRRPAPGGIDRHVDHSSLDRILTELAANGIDSLAAEPLAAYTAGLTAIDPDTLSRDEALAFWIDLYNALALDLARRSSNAGSVLRTRGGFTDRVVEVAGERLSLDAIEHGKIRRFGDPRIHAALVCGSASCPTLRSAAYTGNGLDGQLDDQMRHFLAAGGAEFDRENGIVRLSRVFLWYGADLARPHRMPTLLPARRRAILHALSPWFDPQDADWVTETQPTIEFQDYDWSLRCSVRPPAP
jgi:hypothetical protein